MINYEEAKHELDNEIVSFFGSAHYNSKSLGKRAPITHLETFILNKYDENATLKEARSVVEKAVGELREARSNANAEDKKVLFNESVLDEIIADPAFPFYFNEDEAKWLRKDVKAESDNLEDNQIRMNDSAQDIVNEVFTYIRNTNKPIAGYDDGAVSKIINGKVSKCISTKFAQAMSVIRFNPDNVSYLDDKLKVIYDYFDVKEPYDVFSAVMKHWMANCKRATYQGGKRVWHQWLNWFGGQGIGKSHFVDVFTAPYELSRCNVTRVSDLVETEQNAWLWANVILTCDELGFKSSDNENTKSGGISIHSVQTLKSILTGEYINQREYFANGKYSQVKVPNTASLMSTANQHLFNVICDEEGMRRFVEFTCRCKKHPKEDWVIIDGIDFAKMWSGINPNEIYFDPHSEVGKKLDKIQATYIKMPSTVIEWVKYVFSNPSTWIDLKFGDIFGEYEAYTKWMDVHRKKAQQCSLATLEKVCKTRNLRTILALCEPTEDDLQTAMYWLKRNEKVGTKAIDDVGSLIRDLYIETFGQRKFDALTDEEDVKF